MIELPDFPHPIASAIHPCFDPANKEDNNGWLSALMYPQGSPELLQIGTDFCMWAFAFDDEY